MAERSSGWVGSDAERLVGVEDARAITSALIAPGTGIAARSGFAVGPASPGLVTASGTADTNVHVGAFQYVMPNSRGTFPYIVTLDSPKTIDVLLDDPADPANERYDLIIAQQSDATYGDPSSPFEVKRITGVPSATPVDPTPTGSPDYITLARIRVTPGATAITSGMIDDLRPGEWTVARGGVLPCTSVTRPAAPYDGMTIYETDTGTVRVWNATAATWSQVLTEVASTFTLGSKVRIPHVGNASASSTAHAWQIGSSTGLNLRADGNEILAADNGAASTLHLNTTSGGLVQVGAGGIDVDGGATFDALVTLSPPEGASSQALALNHGWGVYADNLNVMGAAGTRLWIDGPDNGDLVIGPRNGGQWLNDLRLKTDVTTGNAANMFINSSTGTIGRSTSSLRYKVDVTDLTLDLAALRALRPVRFRSRQEVEADPETTQTYVGLIAEEVHEAGLHEFVHYHRDERTGESWADGVQYDRLVVAQHLLIADLEERVTAQAEQIAALTARIDALGQA